MTTGSQVSKKFLLTGATGYLGPWLVREIMRQFGPGSVVCLIPVVLPTVEEKSLAYLHSKGIPCLPCDLMSYPVLRERVPEFDVLIHMAANTRTDLPESKLQVNTVGTGNLLGTLAHSLNGKRVVFTSTSAAVDRDSPPQGSLTEDSPCRPRTGYGKSKLKAEAILKERSHLYGYEYTILRLTTLYGPGMRGGLFHAFATWAPQGHFLGRINWPGRASFIFVEDAARILLWFSLAEAGKNQTYFVSSGENCTIGELAERIRQQMDCPSQTWSLPSWFWRATQRVVWLPVIKKIVPWRLANILDDSLLCDPARMRAAYPESLTFLPIGLDRTFGPGVASDEVARALA